MNRGMQICRSVPFFAKSINPPKLLFKSESTARSENRGVKFKGKLVHGNATVNFAQRVKEGNMLDDNNTVQFQ